MSKNKFQIGAMLDTGSYLAEYKELICSDKIILWFVEESGSYFYTGDRSDSGMREIN